MKRISAPESENLVPTWTDGFGPELLVVALLLGLFAALVLRRRLFRPSGDRTPGSRTRQAGGHARPFRPGMMRGSQDLANPRHQIDAISRVEFERRRLLNKDEAPLLPLLEDAVRKLGRGHRVMAQTSLGELIGPREVGPADQRRDAFASINSKRLDFAIIDRQGYLACAIEYQGSGHHQGGAFVRDAVKREALRRAGVPFVEVVRDYSRADLEQTVSRLLAQDPPGSEHGQTTVHM